MKLIDKSKIDFTTIEPYEYASEEMEVVFKEDIERLPEVKAIAKSVIDDIINKLTDLANHKIKPISFDQELAINICIDIINKTIAESEENKMQDNVLEKIKRRLENEEEMSFASFEEYAELYGYNETEDYFSFGLKRAIEIISVYIKLEKDEN